MPEGVSETAGADGMPFREPRTGLIGDAMLPFSKLRSRDRAPSQENRESRRDGEPILHVLQLRRVHQTLRVTPAMPPQRRRRSRMGEHGDGETTLAHRVLYADWRRTLEY